MHTQVGVGGGMQLGDTPIPVNAGNLARFDVVVLDERAWSALGDAQRAALNEAVRGGLGMLLRVTAALSEPERRRLLALGFTAQDGRDSISVRLSSRKRDDDAERARIGPGTQDSPRDTKGRWRNCRHLTRRTVRTASSDALPMLRDETGTPLGFWRAQGRGRVAVWTLTDSYRLVLAGRSDMYGELWSDAIATLARARPRQEFAVDGEARQDQRMSLCGVAAGANVISP